MSAFDAYTSDFSELLAEMERFRTETEQLLFGSWRTEPDPPEEDLSEELKQLIDTLRRARSELMRNPVGAGQLVSFLVAEGQRYADTQQGNVWKEALLASPHIEYLRDLWETVSLDIFNGLQEGESVPAAWIDLLTEALRNRPDIEAVIRALRFNEVP